VRERLEELRSRLGRPYYESDDVLLYHGDCLEILPAVPSGCVDLTVTSPPYNIGKEYEQVLPLDDYLAWCSTWISAVWSASADRGSFWLNVGYVPVSGRGKAVPLPYLLWDRTPFYFLQEVVWNYGAGVAAKRTFSPRNEKFLWYVRDGDTYHFDLDAVRDPDVKYPDQKKNGRPRCNPLGKNPTDVWQFPKVTSGANRSSVERTGHPAQFPLAVVDRVVKACSPRDGLVLDPFVGSGTTCVAALRLGRCSVGIDLSRDYLDLAVRRLEAERAPAGVVSGPVRRSSIRE
jgi:adenine-specific DNA-methyltransferase